MTAAGMLLAEPAVAADRRTLAQNDETDHALLHRLLRAAGMKLEVTAAGGDTAAGHARATVPLSPDAAPVEAEGEHVMRVQQHLARGPVRTGAVDEESFATTRFDLAPVRASRSRAIRSSTRRC